METQGLIRSDTKSIYDYIVQCGIIVICALNIWSPHVFH